MVNIISFILIVVVSIQSCRGFSHDVVNISNSISSESESATVFPVQLTSNSIFENIQVAENDLRSQVFKKREISFSGRSDIKAHGRSKAHNLHKIVISVKQSNIDILENYVNDISDPDSENFGAVITRDEIAAITDHLESTDYIIHHLEQLWRKEDFVSIEKSAFGEYITGLLCTWVHIFFSFYHLIIFLKSLLQFTYWRASWTLLSKNILNLRKMAESLSSFIVRGSIPCLFTLLLILAAYFLWSISLQ